jgi:hypothetical protein
MPCNAAAWFCAGGAGEGLSALWEGNMKVHFFDKDGNFLKSDDIEESRIRTRLTVVVDPKLRKSESYSAALEKEPEPWPSMAHVSVFKGAPIYGEKLDRLVYGPQKPLFYLYVEIPR